MGLAVGPVVRRLLPPGRGEPCSRTFDPGTQRAILRLYRTSPPEALAAAGARLGTIAAPALVLHGADDRYIPARSPTGSPPRSATGGWSTSPAPVTGRGSTSRS